MSLPRLISVFRDAVWLNAERMRVYSAMLLAAFMALAIAVCVTASRQDSGNPLGGDFLSFYAASKLALSGHAADAWIPRLHEAVENQLFHGDHGYLAFFYPPPYLMLCTPLGLLPFNVALVLWLGTTTVAAVVLVRLHAHRINPDVKLGIVPFLAFPALWINLSCGQNGALMLVIVTGGFLLLDRRPIVAGLVLGLLVIKPQLAILLPFVLAVSDRWKTFIATGISAVTGCALAYAAFGQAGYLAFLHNSTFAQATLNNNMINPAYFQSLFAALRVFGAPLSVAYGAHLVLSAGVVAATCYAIAVSKPSAPALAALTVSATLLVTPFVLNYDLLLSTLPMLWLVLNGVRDGFRPWEKAALLVIAFEPLVARYLDTQWHVPVTPVVMMMLFALTLRRALATSPTAYSDPIESDHALNF